MRRVVRWGRRYVSVGVEGVLRVGVSGVSTLSGTPTGTWRAYVDCPPLNRYLRLDVDAAVLRYHA